MICVVNVELSGTTDPKKNAEFSIEYVGFVTMAAVIKACPFDGEFAWRWLHELDDAELVWMDSVDPDQPLPLRGNMLYVKILPLLTD